MKQKGWESLGKLLRQGREEKSLTQAEVATMLGYGSPQYISNFERGLCAPPMKNLSKLVTVYGLDKKQVGKILIESYEAEVSRVLSLRLPSENRRAK